MFGLERDCLLQGIAPLPFRLPGQGKHQVDANVGKSSAAKNMKRLFCLCCVMLAAQQFQKLVVPSLHAEADTVDTRFA